MKTDLLELVDIIRREVEVFQALLDALTRERDVLVSQDVSALEACLKEQESLVERSRALEAARAAAARRLAGALGTAEAPVTLKTLIAQVQGPEAGQLSEMREQLLALQDRIGRANQQNAALVKQSMKYVDKSIQVLTGAGPATGVYGQSGKVASRSTARAVLNQVV